jgi:hypothetical protein
MARPVEDEDEFLEELEAIRERPPERRPRLLAFFLFDERQSHRQLLEFARLQFDWLDRLAASHQMILFFFLPEAEPAAYGGSQSEILVAKGERTIANPSLHVARRFGIGPSELPGVVFFTELDTKRPGPHEGVFWPLDTDLFEGDARAAEDEFSHLFKLVQAASMEAGESRPRRLARFTLRRRPQAVTPPSLLLTALRRRVQAEQRNEKARPILAAFGSGAVRIVTFPGALIEATTIAFAQGLGQGMGGRVMGGG